MSDTVLSFMDFFWIWFVVAIASGGSTYLPKADARADDFEEMKQQLAALTVSHVASHVRGLTSRDVPDRKACYVAGKRPLAYLNRVQASRRIGREAGRWSSRRGPPQRDRAQ